MEFLCYYDITMSQKKNSRRKLPSTNRFVLRYNSRQDYGLIQRAAEAEHMSVNSWIVRLSLPAARRALKKATKLGEAAAPEAAKVEAA